MDGRPPVTVVKDLSLKLFKNLLDTGVDVHGRIERMRRRAGHPPERNRRFRSPAATHDGLIQHQLAELFGVDWGFHPFKSFLPCHTAV